MFDKHLIYISYLIKFYFLDNHFQKCYNNFMAHELLNKKEDIIAWLHSYSIGSYELIENEQYGYVVDSNKSVYLSNLQLASIQVKFNRIDGGFYCADNELTTLLGAPEYINGDFDVSRNKLTSLEFSPNTILGLYRIAANKLTTLNGISQNLGGSLDISYNPLTSLEYCPQLINGNFYCNNCLLTSLEHGPTIIMKNFNCSHNKIKNLKECPQIVKMSYWCNDNMIESLLGIQNEIYGYLNLSHNELETIEGMPKQIHGKLMLHHNKLKDISLEILPNIFEHSIELYGNSMLNELQQVNDINQLRIILEKRQLSTQIAEKFKSIGPQKL